MATNYSSSSNSSTAVADLGLSLSAALLQSFSTHDNVVEGVVVALCAALAASSLSALSPKALLSAASSSSSSLSSTSSSVMNLSWPSASVHALLQNIVLASLFVLAAPTLLAMLQLQPLAFLHDLHHALVSSGCDTQMAMILGAATFLCMCIMPKLFMPISASDVKLAEDGVEYEEDATAAPDNDRDVDNNNNSTTKLSRSEREAEQERKALKEIGEDLNFSIYEPGPGFFRFHFMSMPVLLSTAVCVTAVYLATMQLRSHQQSSLSTFTVLLCVMLLPPVYLLWRSLSFAARYPLMYAFQLVVGIALTVNFVIFWAIPIFGQGQSFRHGLKYIFRPFYRLVDESSVMRRFAAKYIYAQPRLVKCVVLCGV